MDNTKELPTVISFCSGYGGIERGLDFAGVEHRVVAYVEIEAFAIANLVSKMESGQLDPAPIWSDLKTFPAHLFRGAVDIITGGYPCQPFSAAGERKGEDDPRHLWPYIRQHIKTIRPDRCFFENVEGHISLGLSSVISDLEEDGFAATWGIFSANEVGAPHQRKRVFIMANSECERCQGQKRSWEAAAERESIGHPPECGSELPDPGSKRPDCGLSEQEQREEGYPKKPDNSCDRRYGGARFCDWPPEPGLGRVVDGCADRVDRIRLLGNGVVPQTAARAWEVLDAKS